MKTLKTFTLSTIGVAAALFCSVSNAEMFSIDPKITTPGVVLEAEYEYYGQEGKLSKLNGLHLRPAHGLPVESVAIVDHLNDVLKKRNKLAPEVFITDRLIWGRYQLFSALEPLSSGKQISKPYPVVCESKYRCKVYSYFEDNLNPEQQNLLKWVRYHLKTRYSEALLQPQQRATISQEFKLFSIYDPNGTSSPAINFWIDLVPYARLQQIKTDEELKTHRTELQTLHRFINTARNLSSADLDTESIEFNTFMATEMNSLFAGQFTYPYTQMTLNFDKKPVYSRTDLSALEFIRTVQSWNSFTPLGYINSGEVRYLAFYVNDAKEDLHILPLQCDGKLCKKMNADLIRTNENRLLNHPLLLPKLASYLVE